MEKKTICLSFDDGRNDNFYNALPILKKYNIKASFHVITGFIDKTKKVCNINPNIKYMSLNQLYELKLLGNDISSHSNNHTIEIDQINNSLKKLKNWNFNESGFSIPHSNESLYEDDNFFEIINKNNLSYIRTGKNLKKLTFFKKILYFLYRLTKYQFFYDRYNSININYYSDFNPYKIISIPIHSFDSEDVIINFIKKYSNKNCFIVLMFHSIVSKFNKTNVEDNWCWTDDKFDILCKFLSKNNYNVMTLQELVDGVKNNNEN